MRVLKIPNDKRYKELTEKLVFSKPAPREKKKTFDDNFSNKPEDTLEAKKEKIKKYLVDYFGIAESCLRIDIDSNTGIAYVDCDRSVHLSNMKLSSFPYNIKWRTINGNFNVYGNNFIDMSSFPEEVVGELNCNNNLIRNFDNCATKSVGLLAADKQRVKTDYPLTYENFMTYKLDIVSENVVFIGKDRVKGELLSINESNSTGSVKLFESKEIQDFSLDDIYPLHGNKFAAQIKNKNSSN